MSCILDVLAPKIIGDEVAPTRTWEKLYAHCRDFGSAGPYIDAISAIDIALWDIMGKTAGLPVWALLGGRYRDRVLAYATGCYFRGVEHTVESACDADAQAPLIAAEAKRYVDSGFKMLKIKVGLMNLKDEEKRVKAIREAVGDDITIGADANHAYNAFTALKCGRMLEKYNVVFFEEPVAPEDHEGYRHLRNKLDIAIAGGECSFTRWGFKPLLTTGMVDIAQPDLGACGGLSEFLKIATIASAHGVYIIPHIWGSGVAVATGLQILAVLAPSPNTINPIPMMNEPVIEFDRNPNALRDDLLFPFKFELTDQGQVMIPNGPGIGVDVNMETLQKFTVSSGCYPPESK
jgi:D-galactarolactone cycloisomerase